ncbi:hypothetical protein HMPREF9148_01024 [Prevotella sp. F0091]|nr:hypothetical protein HMPREF9148_01024 [Prevotella sp. F0091]
MLSFYLQSCFLLPVLDTVFISNIESAISRKSSMKNNSSKRQESLCCLLTIFKLP